MREYEIYVPTTHGDGSPVDEAIIEGVKQSMRNAFGGYTHLTQRCDGAWRMGGVEFREEVTILRVLDQGPSEFDMQNFKCNLEALLRQQEVLIVVREVSRVE